VSFPAHFRNKSISLTGGNDQVAPALGNRIFLLLHNNSSLHNLGFTMDGTAPVIGSAGTITLVPGGTAVFDVVVPQNEIRVTGTAAEPCTYYEA
jgi:hypothetical protein